MSLHCIAVSSAVDDDVFERSTPKPREPGANELTSISARTSQPSNAQCGSGFLSCPCFGSRSLCLVSMPRNRPCASCHTIPGSSCRCLANRSMCLVSMPHKPVHVPRVDASQTGPCASCRTIPGSGFLLLAIRYKFELHLLAQQR